ncbi:MAG: ACP dehydratase [Candidatus Thiodiazotropha sp.]
MWHEPVNPVPADHPCLAGHFPGNPIVPGTLILDRVIELVQSRYPETEVAEVVTAKFMQPLLPGQAFEVWGEDKPGQLSFECRVNGSPVASGKLALVEAGSRL